MAVGRFIDLGPVSYKAWKNPATGERGREMTAPGGLVVWICIAAMVIAGLGWAVPALADPGDNRDATATTRPDDLGDERGRGQGDGSGSGQNSGVGRGNGDQPTTTTASSSGASSTTSTSRATASSSSTSSTSSPTTTTIDVLPPYVPPTSIPCTCPPPES